MPDGRDWVAVSAGRCPECGLAAGSVDVRALAGNVAAAAERWMALLAGDVDALRARPRSAGWSALEYGAHVAGVCAVFAERIDRVLADDEPDLEWWDQGAAVEEAYDEQPPSTVGLRIAAAAGALGAALDAVGDGAWDRAGVCRGGPLTVAVLGRCALHEAHHHLADAGRVLAVAAGGDARRPEVEALLAARRMAGPVDAREGAALDVFEEELARLAAPFDRHADPTHVTSSAIVVSHDGDRVVLHRHKRLGLWLQPGGHLDPDERPAHGAVREAAEETGLVVAHPPEGPWFAHVDVHPGGQGHRHLDLRWVLLAGGEPAPGAGESPEVRWFGWDEAIATAEAGLSGALTELRGHFRPLRA